MSFFDLKDVEFQVIDNVVDTSNCAKVPSLRGAGLRRCAP